MDDDITDRAQKHHEAHLEIPDPTPFERIISWVKIAFATRKAWLFLWAMFFGVSGTAIVGQVTDTKPFKEAAIELGLIDADPMKAEPQDVAYEDALTALRADIKVGLTTITEMQKDIREHTHEALYAPLSHDVPEHTHPSPDLAHEHAEYALNSHTHVSEVGEHTHPELSRVVLSSEVQSILESEVKRVFEIELEAHVKLLH